MSLPGIKVPHKLRAVTDEEARTQHALLICTDFDDFDMMCSRLRHEGYVVINRDQSDTSDTVGLAFYLAMLASTDVLALPVDWWTSVVGTQLMQIASWLRLGFIDDTGCVLPTVGGSLR